MSDLVVAPIGVGTWQWGDRQYWRYGAAYQRADVEAAFDAALAAGLDLFDTAELYGRGESEQILGGLIRTRRAAPVVATKYMPFPNRLRESSVDQAVDRSLARLGVRSLDLYYVHWPFSLMPHRALVRALTRVVRDGRVRYVGVSNYAAAGMRRVHAMLAHHGVPLVANQVQYSLVRRAPEVNGVLDACTDLGVALVAYSPLGQGLLTGKYDPLHRPADARRLTGQFRGDRLQRASPLIQALRAIASARGLVAAQVALAWLLRDERVIPIPGVKSAEQARTNAAAASVALNTDEQALLDGLSAPYRAARALVGRWVG
ncbi:MAG: aldo/keto reductase [Actinobacteria bacterium]|nr:aldo/keto reductase [Actinomycetota bacterium]